MRVEVRLVSTDDGRVIWTGDSYDRALKDIVSLQDEISCSIAANLKVVLCGGTGPKKRFTDNTQAYQEYLKGLYHFNKRTRDGIKKSIEHLERAVDLDPRYGMAYAALADSYNMAILYIPLSPEEAAPKVMNAASKALEIDHTLGEAHFAMAAASEANWKWAEALKESEQAIELSPGSARVHYRYAFHLAINGRWDETILAIKRTRELDPLNLVLNVDVAHLLYSARRIDEAFEESQKALDLDPNFYYAHQVLGEVYAEKRMYAQAHERYQLALRLFGGKAPLLEAHVGNLYALAGQKDKAIEILEGLKTRSKREYVPPFAFALINIGLGEKERAFEWIEKSYQERSAYLLLLPDPTCDSLRSDPRYKDLMSRAGLAGILKE